MSHGISEQFQFRAEVVHAAPEPGMSFCPCCDKTPAEFSLDDRVAREPDEVDCGRLSASDERILMECSDS